MKIGFAKSDITPQIGVELCGFGPFLNRHSVGIRDRLWARAMAVEVNDRRIVIITCDLIGITRQTTRRIREILSRQCTLAADAVMVCCSHTHSGPAPGAYMGWGDADPPYLETLPDRIAAAATDAINRLQPAQIRHAETPCEGIAVNREYDQFFAPYEEAMHPDWRPARPEQTDTTCHVLTGHAANGDLLGFITYFGCHPVVCCSACRFIHGDYPGIALNQIERDHPGTVGLFLQGAQGDVNTAMGGMPETESLLALDEIAGRFARSVRRGMAEGTPITVDRLNTALREVVFSRKPWSVGEIRRRLNECEQKIHSSGGDGGLHDATRDTRMQTAYAIALRNMLARHERGETQPPATEIQGIKLGPITLLGSPFETFRAIKNDVCAQATGPVALVVSFVNDVNGYAVDKTCAQRGGCAADMVPLICGDLPFARIHEELVEQLIALDRQPTSQMASNG